MSLVHEIDYGTPAQQVAEQTVTLDHRRQRGDGARRHLDHARGDGCRHPGPQALRHRHRSRPSAPAASAWSRSRAARGTPASCTTPVAPGMVVSTQTERLKQLRRGVMELYISDHPLDCLTCAANGDCELQDMAGAVGLREVRYGYDGENHLDAGEGRVQPVLHLRSVEVHRLLALRARLRGGAGHLRADHRGPRLRSPRSSAGMDEAVPRLANACPAAPACRPARPRR